MRFYDLDVGVTRYGNTFSLEPRELNGLCRPVVEAFRHELATHPPVDGAPFRKLLVELVSAGVSASKRSPELLLDVYAVPVAVREGSLYGEIARKDEALLEAVSRAFAIAKRELAWSDAAVEATLAALRGRHPLGWIQLDHLTKRDRRNGSTCSAVYDVGEGTASVWVLIHDADGRELKREMVADLPVALLESYFPVRSAVIANGQYVLRDRDRNALVAVTLA